MYQCQYRCQTAQNENQYQGWDLSLLVSKELLGSLLVSLVFLCNSKWKEVAEMRISLLRNHKQKKVTSFLLHLALKLFNCYIGDLIRSQILQII